MLFYSIGVHTQSSGWNFDQIYYAKCDFLDLRKTHQKFVKNYDDFKPVVAYMNKCHTLLNIMLSDSLKPNKLSVVMLGGVGSIDIKLDTARRLNWTLVG
jgi:hypothetical protein